MFSIDKEVSLYSEEKDYYFYLLLVKLVASCMDKGSGTSM